MACSKYPAELLSVESPYGKLAPTLGQNTTFTFLAWTRLADMFRQWQELSGLTILVDWAALADVDLAPTSPIACAVIERSWEQSLDGVLEPLGLGWWAVDGQTIQITSLQALERVNRVEFYSVPPKLRAQSARPQSLVDALQKQLAARAAEDGNRRQSPMEFDELSGRLIVLGPPELHRQVHKKLTASHDH